MGKNHKKKIIKNEDGNESEVNTSTQEDMEVAGKEFSSGPNYNIESDTKIEEYTSNKRHLENNDSDSDSEVQQKKPKKKKKQAAPIEATEGTGKKSKKSIRQMKKEKHAQRQAEAAVAAKDQLKTQCLSYLSQWKHDRQNWKFIKAKQVWLYKNKFSKHLIPENSWPLLLEYFESAQGNIRKMLLDDANKVIKQMDDWIETKEKNNSDNEHEETDETNSNKPDDVFYNRARSLIQCLQE